MRRSVVGFPFTWFPVLGGVLRNSGEGDAASDDLKIETVSVPNLQDRIRGWGRRHAAQPLSDTYEVILSSPYSMKNVTIR